ncbi:hypothetical protein O4J56_14070 [Nocardiopsis sp. RSe5-2]|uniref:Uncharacterized protein n=1 Tax=Nocardiopsis endophytica TaxID=3018445 RepID=A0ABT4U492_9ACTN|nr:hypothetical protein [Nocardiopsis endophytica]MDA2811764.1 hypothetical protein [Nocardiopsis endophytica]
MSPKKKNKNKRRTAAARTPAAGASAPGPAADGTGGALKAPSRRRTPVPLDEPRPRWPLALWTLLALVWLGGTALFFILVLAEGLAMMDHQSPQELAPSLRATAWYLIGMLTCALAVPAAGAATAALLRRKIAAGLFALATAASAIAVFTLAGPTEIIDALRGGLSG